MKIKFSESTDVKKGRFGIAAHVLNSAEQVVVAKNAYKHPHFCPEVDWPAMLAQPEVNELYISDKEPCISTKEPCINICILFYVCHFPQS